MLCLPAEPSGFRPALIADLGDPQSDVEEAARDARDYRDQLSNLSGGSDLDGISPAFLQGKVAVAGFSDALATATQRLAIFPGSSSVAGRMASGVPAASLPSAGASFSPGFSSALSRTLGFEGGLNRRDTNGTPSNMGINAAANPGVDVVNLTAAGAAAIYKKNYWDAIRADSMSPQMARVAFDTAVMQGVGQAMRR